MRLFGVSPRYDVQTWNALKLAEVSAYQRNVCRERDRSDQEIVCADLTAFTAELCSNTAITCRGGIIERKRFENAAKPFDTIEVLRDSPRISSTEVELGLDDTTKNDGAWRLIEKALSQNLLGSIDQRNAYAGIEE